jgi:formylglycine-generating enzyme required for sulfatase activity/serine/threonine protein kinase
MSAARESAGGEFPDTVPPRHDADLLATGPDVAGAAEMPARLGRYRVTALLGRGGFGIVYKGYDDELRRDVAIKVPHRERLRTPADADVYLAEARVAAGLDHPHIVPVFDLGRTADGLCFVVSRFIAGCNLAEKIGEARPSWVEVVELTATIAEALHHAHKHGLVHRDVKPGNILLDPGGKPFLADFGLALKEEDVGTGPGVCGTPAYMSPEQANGEGHRVDGRSDIFSLGVVFYELLTGRRPFRGEYPEILTRIAEDDPRPPRQYDDTIPKELERICLKALAKRASGRHTTAKDLADDLRHFLNSTSEEEKSVVRSSIGPAPLAGPTTPSDQRPLKIVPKGLRSFDAHDADFFLELLPGPRDRDGLPDSIAFWETRIEETDPDNTFTVGLIYGPSGCGKSSLVRAGLLPRLGEQVTALYVEATANETESRLLNGLRKHLPELPVGGSLRETINGLRRGVGVPAGGKVLIVLDQFEQWLHGGRAGRVSDRSDPELVQALRQCDGRRVQCVVLVRDDFWMAATRFLDVLEIDLVRSQNCLAVDLFDPRHARKVMIAFGQAFGALPEPPEPLSAEQAAFVEQAVAGLAQEGKVVCVRLALFAEMMKGKPWTPAALAEVGGTEGVGVRFLEDTFSSGGANPKHRLHQAAARAVLRALLPDSGTDIKGQMRSHAELLAASAYAGRPKDFADLLRILDGELRLVTPTDPEGATDGEPGALATGGAGQTPVADAPGSPGTPVANAVPPAPGSPDAGARFYQLTHDYLVPSLRDWLTRKQKETRRGRAELLLADRAAVWNARRENRQLPSLSQYLRIRWWTRKNDWTPPQRKMMRQARRYHLVRTAALTAGLLLACLTGWYVNGSSKAYSLRNRLLESTTADVPGIVREMGPYRRWLNPLLRDAYAAAVENHDARRQLHTSLALLPADAGQVDYLRRRLLRAEPEELVVIREALYGHKDELVEEFWAILSDPKHDLEERFRAAGALAGYDPDSPRWEKVHGDVAAKLVAQHSLVVRQWVDALAPAGKRLLVPLASFLEDEKPSGGERETIAKVYGKYAGEDGEEYARLEVVLREKPAANATPEARVALAKRQVNVGVALVVIGRGEKAWQLLKHSADPTRRSYLIERLGPGGADPKQLVGRLKQEKDVTVRRALLLSLGQFSLATLPEVERQNVLPLLLALYRDDPDPGIHGAAEWLVRQWHQEGKLRVIDRQLRTGKVQGKRGWYLNRRGQTMIIVPTPGVFLMGEQDPRFKFGDERLHRRRINRTYAIASKEVTVQQFLEFRKAHDYRRPAAPTADCPVNDVSWYDTAAYCNWLSEKEGIPEDQWCYLPNKEGKYAEGMTLAPDYLRRTGYRLPTEAEWEYACRAGSATRYAFGEPNELLGNYAWYAGNSFSKSHPVGWLKPNDLGLSDLHGNAWEWCIDTYSKYKIEILKEEEWIVDEEDATKGIESNVNRLVRGGAFNFDAQYVRSSNRNWPVPAYRNLSLGFRPARTCR